MPIAELNEQVVFVRLELSPAEIPGLLERHAKKYPGAAALEQRGAALVEAGVQVVAALEFVEAVVRWGRGQRFVGRVLDQNAAEQITGALQEANALLNTGQVAAAVSRLQQLRYLGQSFASKIARFMNPAVAVILDEVIRSALGYREDQAGYQEFLHDCQASLALLAPHHSQLRVCDVEAAIFAKIQGY
ncbi:hypothetical protein NLM31_38105 [Bradyrhizobium sp. CCGUVB4N]|uniref:hypothetical protein n=1 Tax=Bradyrhizobium sp. CCGUVB4N TaxID=2949631 RepID=UPI0020B1A58B|nr:hypothetical protein [Bradyrhizobium sp. CCGUVB4N]MCP3386211.1 hypothetical protein [Bradyrhizobium sp. CCGUVB4N]